MKKLWNYIVSGCIAVSFGAMAVQNVTASSVNNTITGDVNGDGLITSNDALLILQKTVGDISTFPADETTEPVVTTAEETTVIYTEPPMVIPTGDFRSTQLTFLRVSMNVSVSGSTVNITVKWSSGAMSYTKWTMNGTFNYDTNTVTYSNGKRYDVDNGVQTLLSSGESGSFAFDTGGLIYWTPDEYDICQQYGENYIEFARE